MDKDLVEATWKEIEEGHRLVDFAKAAVEKGRKEIKRGQLRIEMAQHTAGLARPHYIQAAENFAKLRADGASLRDIAKAINMHHTTVSQYLDWRDEGYPEDTPFIAASRRKREQAKAKREREATAKAEADAKAIAESEVDAKAEAEIDAMIADREELREISSKISLDEPDEVATLPGAQSGSMADAINAEIEEIDTADPDAKVKQPSAQIIGLPRKAPPDNLVEQLRRCLEFCERGGIDWDAAVAAAKAKLQQAA